MENTVKKHNKGDVAEFLTSDGWECGKITEVKENSVIAFMYYLSEEREFEFKHIR